MKYLILFILIGLLIWKPKQHHCLPIPRELRNSGSCGWIAYYLSLKLKEPHKIVAYKFYNYNEFHIVIETNRGVIDGSGYFNVLHPLRLLDSKIITREQLYVLLHDYKRWNPQFKLKDTLLIRNWFTSNL